MTTTTRADISLQYVRDRLTDPHSDAVYQQESEKLELLEMELKKIERKAIGTQKRRRDMQMETSEDVVKASKLEAEVDLLHRQAENQHSLVLSQQLKVNEALSDAKRVTAEEAAALWHEEVLPEVIDVVERLKELQSIYTTLRHAGGKLSPEFPVYRFPELWLKKRLQERDDRDS
ncbi:MAG TPA: hypothetical protein VJA46_12170 [Acidimicrobiia bacterium]|nr:hypothetical protein [Acidimicrobiia bacterium]